MADAEEAKEFLWEFKGGEEAHGKFVKLPGPASVAYPNGDTFDGSFSAELLKCSRGSYTWSTAPGASGWVPEEGYPEGSAPVVKYVGEYLDGRRHGLGQAWLPNGDRYHGMWAHGLPEGDGTLFYANGDLYSGGWAEGLRCGKGAYVFAADESQLVGVWAGGSLRAGKWVWKDGTSWHGAFARDRPLGRGVFYFPNGNQQEGEFVEEGDADDEDAPKVTVWRGGPVTPASAPAAVMTAAPLPVAAAGK